MASRHQLPLAPSPLDEPPVLWLPLESELPDDIVERDIAAEAVHPEEVGAAVDGCDSGGISRVQVV